MALHSETRGAQSPRPRYPLSDMAQETLPSLSAPIEHDPTEANGWWVKNAPLATGIWGKPVLYGGIPNPQALAMAIPEISTKIVWENGWWFYEHSLGLFAATSEARVEALFRKMVIRAGDEYGTKSMKAITIPLITLSSQVVESARALLAVGPEYWDTHPRIVAGRVEQAPPLETVAEFAGEFLEKGEKQSLPLNLAYERYVLFCERKGTSPLKKRHFGEELGRRIHKRFGTRLRNDVRDGSKVTRGWKAVGLKA